LAGEDGVGCHCTASAPAALDEVVWVPENRSWVLSCEFVGEALGPR